MPYEEKPLVITVTSKEEETKEETEGKVGFDVSSLVNLLMSLLPLFIVFIMLILVVELVRR